MSYNSGRDDPRNAGYGYDPNRDRRGQPPYPQSLERHVRDSHRYEETGIPIPPPQRMEAAHEWLESTQSQDFSYETPTPRSPERAQQRQLTPTDRYRPKSNYDVYYRKSNRDSDIIYEDKRTIYDDSYSLGFDEQREGSMNQIFSRRNHYSPEDEDERVVDELNAGNIYSGDNVLAILGVDRKTQTPLRTEATQKGEKVSYHPITGQPLGFLRLDCQLPSLLLEQTPQYDGSLGESGGLSNEFVYTRYTAVTCGPSNFVRNEYFLTQAIFPRPRETEIMVVVTLYKEDDVQLARTLKGVFANIKYLQAQKTGFWGDGEAWKKIVVCIVSDGRDVINKRALALLTGLGVYQGLYATEEVKDKKVKAHIFEHTSLIGITKILDEEKLVQLTGDKAVPVQILFCLKEENAQKINSHRWCFQAFGPILKPKIVVLLDAGTQPKHKAIYHLWTEFDRDSRVAGACGEITASLRLSQIITNPLVYAQNFEYKISNILDKPTESVFGFISVLPGAFSAYRYEAMQDGPDGNGPLHKYYRGEFLHAAKDYEDEGDDEWKYKKSMIADSGVFTSNMYLAEDRILCFELVCKLQSRWLLRYCKAASAETDVPDRLAEFVLQRRRWLNGSFFAAIYALAHFPRIWDTAHSGLRKFFLHLEFLYQLMNLIISWFSIGSYFLVFRILTTSLADPRLGFAPGKVFSVILLWLYLASIVTTFVLSFGNPPKGTERFYVIIVIFFAILMAYMIFAAIFLAVHSINLIRQTDKPLTFLLFFRNAQFRDLVIATSSTYVLYFVASFIYFEPWHMFTSFGQYILLSPSYVNVLNIYAFCNIDDISWGTKGETKKVAFSSMSPGAPLRGTDKARQKAVLNESLLVEMNLLKTPGKEVEVKEGMKHEDYFAFIRSMTVLIWISSNFLIIALVLETGGFNQFESDVGLAGSKKKRAEVYLTVILWTVALLAGFRFVGCVLYLLNRMVNSFRGSDVRVEPAYFY